MKISDLTTLNVRSVSMNGKNGQRRMNCPNAQNVKVPKQKEQSREQSVPNENIEIIVSDPKAVVYWQVQVDTLQALHRVGVHFQLNDRLPLFQIIQMLRKIGEVGEYPENEVLDAWAHVDRLLKYRQQGYEPESNEGKYK